MQQTRLQVGIWPGGVLHGWGLAPSLDYIRKVAITNSRIIYFAGNNTRINPGVIEGNATLAFTTHQIHLVVGAS
ncbi:MAG: hypothetical protein AMXMBFR48_10760 [Ignavibacteriales bacterium]